jgi:P63C domain
MNNSKGSSAGGLARRDALTPEERAAIARRAAEVRWADDSPVADYEGSFKLGAIDVSAAVLRDGTRIINQSTFLRLLGRSRSPKAGTGVLSSIDQLPFFLKAEALAVFIDEDLVASTKPVFFRYKNGRKAVGYRAHVLPEVAEVYLRLRDHHISVGTPVPKPFRDIITACDLLTRALAQVGIAALVDEATGYQAVREHDALQRILDQWLNGYARKWAKTFPDMFWEKLLRAKGYESYIGLRRPQFVGHWVNDVVYSRLAPGILSKVRELNPKTGDSGARKHKHFQFLTDDHGVPELREHLTKVMTVADLAISMHHDFDQMLDRVLPRYGDTIELPFSDESAAASVRT